MHIAGWVYNRLSASSNISSVTTTITPNISDYSIIPCISYGIVTESKNLIMQSPIMFVKCLETTQDRCILLNKYIRNLFNETTSRIYGSTDTLKIESVEIINNLPAIYDNENKQWFGNLDIKINYYE